MEMRCQMAYPLDQQGGNFRHTDVQGEALTYQSRNGVLMFENIRAGNNAARAVTEHVDRQAGIRRSRDRHQLVDIAGIVREALDEETLAVRAAATSQIERISRQPMRRELFGRPDHVRAMRVESVDQHDHRPRGTLRRPRSRENIQAVCGLKRCFLHVASFVFERFKAGRWQGWENGEALRALLPSSRSR